MNTNDLDILSCVEQKLIKGVLKPTYEYPIIPLKNTIVSYQQFFEDAPHYFECKDVVLRTYVDKGVKVIYRLTRKFLEYIPPSSSYKFCKEKGEPYEGIFHIRTTIHKQLIYPDKIINHVSYSSTHKYQVPVFVGVYGRPVDGSKEEDDPCEFACCFFGKNHVTRTLIHLLDSNNSSPQVKLTKNKSKTSSYETNAFVNSFTCRIVTEEQYKQPQYLNFTMNTKKSSFIVSSKNTRNFLPSIEIIHLISYLTRLSLFQIEDIILALFSKKDINNPERTEIYDPEAYYNIYRFFRQIEDTFETNEEKSIKRKISEYIHITLKNVNETIGGFLPMVNSMIILCKELLKPNTIRKSSYRMKGYTLLEYTIQYLQAVFQSTPYPSNDHILHIRTYTPGMLFVKRVNEELQQRFNKAKFAVEQAKLNTSELKDEPLKIDTGLQESLFTSAMSSKTSQMFVATKATATLFSEVSKINQVNTRTKNTNHLKKTKRRDVDESNFLHTGIATTPDNEYVNLQHNLNAAVTSGNKTLKTQTLMTQAVLSFIFNHKYFKSASTEIPYPNDIFITLIDKSSAVIGFVAQEHGEEFFQDLRESKRKGLFHSLFIDIWRVPNYKQSNSTSLLLPISVYNNIRISFGHHDMFRPAMIVKDGILNISKYNQDDPIFELRPEEICAQDYTLLEYLGSGELTYTNHVLGIRKFLALSEKDRKRVDYVLIGGILCRSFNEALSNDAERTNGARATFACGQQKNNINSITSSFLNNNESSKTLARHQHKPFLTNPVNVATKADDKTYSTYVYVGWASYHNAEDSCAINRSTVKNFMEAIKNKPYKSSDSFSSKDVSRQAINNANYDEDGKIRIQSAIREGEAFNNEVVLRVQNGIILKNDKSCIYDNKQPGRVDNLIQTDDGWKYNIVSKQELAVGDKLSDLCAQKFTIQEIFDPLAMPYNALGRRLEIVLNSFSTIGRETYNVFSTLVKAANAIATWEPSRGPIQLDFPPFTQISLATLINETANKYETTYDIPHDEALEIANRKEYFFCPETGKMFAQPWTAGLYPVCRLTQTAQDSYSVKKEFEFNANNEVSGSRMSEMDLMAQAETGAIALQEEMQPDNIMIRKNFMICQHCGQPATKMHKQRSTFWSCLACENAGLTPVIKAARLPQHTVKIMQIISTLGLSFITTKEANNHIFPKQ